MEVYYSLDHLPSFRDAVLTIGSFDGLHLGHQALMQQVISIAKEKDGESVVITFDPHPRQIIYPKDASLKLLSTTPEKIQLLAAIGIDKLVVVPFNVAFSQMSADEYIVDFLCKNFQPAVLIIGYDHRFGLNRQGDVNYLRWHGKTRGFEVVEIAAQEIAAITVSSTKVRNAILAGDIAQANTLLGYAYQLNGTVVKGAQIGRSLGFPTANLAVGNTFKLLPADGIYAARAQWGNQSLEGMLYIGSRPSLADGNERSIELHLFDFNQDLYGEQLAISLLGFIRQDAQFESLAALQAQLQKDETATRAFLQQSRLAATPKLPQKTYSTAVVILNYNGKQYLAQYLPALIDSLPANCHLIIADNKSTDDSLSWLHANFPEITCIALDQNYGFAGGYNEALKQIKADIYVLLNSDVAVSPNWLSPCLAHFYQDESVAAVQPKIRAAHEPGKFEYAGAAGGYIDSLGYPFCRGRIFATTEIDQGQYDEVAEVFWATGATLFIRADLFHRIGGFEADYFAHAEEIDLCWRLKRAGYRILAEPAAEVYHVGGGTLNYNTPRKTYLNFRNTLVTSFKNERGLKLLWWLPLRLSLDGLAAILFLSQGNWAHIGSILRAHFHFYPRAFKWWQRRQERTKAIEALRIGADRSDFGRVKDSIVWHYYVLGHQRFSQIVRPKEMFLSRRSKD